MATDASVLIDRAIRGRILVVGQMPPLGRDLDLVARPPEWDAVMAALRAQGFIKNQKPFGGRRIWTQQWIRLDGCSCDAIDVVPSNRWGLPADEEARFFEEATAIEGFQWLCQPAPHHTLLLLARRLAGGRFGLPDKRRQTIESMLHRDGQAWARARERAPQWGAEFALAALGRAYRTDRPISNRERLKIARERVSAGLRREGSGALFERATRLLRPPGASVVTFSGLDGAGKSTQVRALAKTIDKLGGEVAIEWMPLGHNPVLDPIRGSVKRILRRVGHLGFSGEVAEASVVRDEPVIDPGKAFRQQSVIVTEAWTTVVALTTALHHRRAALARSLHGGVIIFDRYVLDAAAQMHYFYGDERRFRFQKWLLRAVSPKPLCAFFLDVPPQTVVKRKHLQYSLDQLDRQFGHYRRLAEGLGVRRLPGERSKDELCELIARGVVDAFGQ